MNPFRRVWPREIGLYLTALALLAQALMGLTHAAHALPSVDASICAVDHERAPARAPTPACPLCQIPNFAGPLPPAADFPAPVTWDALVYVTDETTVAAASFVVLPPARGPPAAI